MVYNTPERIKSGTKEAAREVTNNDTYLGSNESTLELFSS
jgi:hypothetical protein